MQTLGLSPSTPKPSNRLRDLLWPVIKDEVSALTAARNGMYVSFLVALVTGIVALFTNRLGLLDAALFLMVGIGIRQLSRVAAVTGLALYVLSIVVRAVQGQFGVLGVIGLIFTAVLASAVRAAFFAHRWRREHPADTDLANPPMAGGVLLERTPMRLWPVVKPVFFIAIVILGGIEVALLFAFVFVQPWVIPNATMEPTLLNGDRIFALRRTWMGAVHRGDMVAFEYPVDRRQKLVKRIVGVPGDRIRFVHKALWLNGRPLSEPYAVHLTNYIDRYRDEFPSQPSPQFAPDYPSGDKMLKENVRAGEVVVPPGAYFVLGDNRDSSLDSRYWGFVPAENIVGRPWLIYGSTDSEGRDRPGRAGRLLPRFPLGFSETSGPGKAS